MWVSSDILLVLAWTAVTASSADLFRLTILHTNDLHSRFDQVNAHGSACTDQSLEQHQCFGGFARIKRAVQDAKLKYPNHLFLNAGDLFQGTVWYSLLKWPIVANMTRPLQMTASSLGNHEFDDGVADLVRFGKAVQDVFPLLACNVDLSQEPDLQGIILPSMKVRVADISIGIIGYVTPETKDLSQTGSVIFLDEIESIQKQVDELISQNTNIIVAVGHSGYEVDIQIAKEVNGLDLVVGGHTNTFLWSGETEPGLVGGRPHGDYPTVIEKASGEVVLVVQTNGYGRYLGQLHVDFDADGRIQGWEGSPVLMDHKLPLDEDMNQVVSFYRDMIHEKMRDIVGESSVFLDGGRPLCRLYECDFGNFITDAMASEMNVQIATINSGAIKGSFNQGNLSMADIYETMPFSNTIDVVTMAGSTLKSMLEHSVSEYDSSHYDPHGRFLQISGLVVHYDVRQPPGSRVAALHVGNPIARDDWEAVNDDDLYDVALPSYLVSGGDRYTMIPDELVKHKNIGLLDKDLMLSYLKKYSPIPMPASGRIIVIDYATHAMSSATEHLPLIRIQFFWIGSFFILIHHLFFKTNR